MPYVRLAHSSDPAHVNERSVGIGDERVDVGFEVLRWLRRPQAVDLFDHARKDRVLRIGAPLSLSAWFRLRR